MQIFASCKIFILTMFLQGYVIHVWRNLYIKCSGWKWFTYILFYYRWNAMGWNSMENLRKMREILCLLWQGVNLFTIGVWAYCNCVIVLGEGGTHFQLTPSHWSAYLCAFDLEISRAMYSETSSASASSAMGVIFQESSENFHESFWNKI